jgi:CDP-paratose 2-epimerase
MRILITGSSGLIGSEVCAYFDSLGWTVHGLDNNQRAVFFGPEGDTRWNQRRLETTLKHFTHHELDIRDRAGVFDLIGAIRPDALVHTAAQPSHDRAAAIPFDDFDTNAVGTLNLLEAIRRQAPQAPFVLLSTNKVYGDAPIVSIYARKRAGGRTPIPPGPTESPRPFRWTTRPTRFSESASWRQTL